MLLYVAVSPRDRARGQHLGKEERSVSGLEAFDDRGVEDSSYGVTIELVLDSKGNFESPDFLLHTLI